jgi:ribose 5-phosphate isomerase RpiB
MLSYGDDSPVKLDEDNISILTDGYGIGAQIAM